MKSAAMIGAVAAMGSVVQGTASAAPKGSSQKLPTSANGWTLEKEANHVSTVWTRPVAGTGLKVDVRIGDVADARPRDPPLPLRSRADPAGRPGRLARAIGKLHKDLPESNLASGTAVQIRPGAGAKGGLFPLQELVLRDILADCEGVVRWGGDDSTVNESLFYIDAGPNEERVRKVADKFRDWDATPGEGAGAEVNVLSPSRRSRADRLARTQRSD
ncbi:hypothetical protein [Streptomyces sp. NBC_01637]|uniref:hypothetical protein n=1 Tax=unclassified Streptomyces TaxID=2593676 RepID=UPI003863B45B